VRSTITTAGRVWISACVLVAVSLIAAGCGAPGGYKIVPIPADKTLEESEVMTEPGLVREKIALIDVSGIIMNDYHKGLFTEGENPVSFLAEKLKAAENDHRVKAVILRINSPGGGVTASDLMHQEIKEFRKRTGRPVIAMMLDVAASGGYYIACACDEIVAEPTTVTGSIGVVMITMSVQGALQKLYIKTDTIKSGQFKDAGSPFRDMTEEDRKIFQGMVNQFYERFLEIVGSSRTKLKADQIRTAADGRVYLAGEALKLGLVDRVGTIRDAVALAKERASISRPVKVVMYHRPLGWAPNVYARAPIGEPSAVNLININLPDLLRPATPTFMYLWAPGP
jgi:protease-4